MRPRLSTSRISIILSLIIGLISLVAISIVFLGIARAIGPELFAHSTDTYSQIARAATKNHLLVAQISIGAPLLWYAIKYSAYYTATFMVVIPWWAGNTIEIFIRLLAALPTVLLGRVVLEGMSGVVDVAADPVNRTIVVAMAILLSALPTAIQVLYPVMYDYPRPEFLAARALGLKKVFVIHRLLYAHFRKSIKVGTQLSLSRVLVEALILLGGFAQSGQVPNQLGEANDASKILTLAYTSISTRTNILVALLLIFIAFIGRVWISGATVVGRTQ